MKVIEINTLQEYINLLNDNNNIILNVSAKWCKPCMTIKNEIDIYMKNVNIPNYIFGKINFDIINKDEVKVFEAASIDLLTTAYSDGISFLHPKQIEFYSQFQSHIGKIKKTKVIN